MGHGLYNTINSPWVMGCTTVLISHGSWVVQGYRFSMGHGLYNTINFPWVMGCTRAWVVQEHGLYRGVCSPRGMGHMPIPGKVINHESPNKDIFDGFPK
jgi:hypothetical protein